jgi:hypothetical protein
MSESEKIMEKGQQKLLVLTIIVNGTPTEVKINQNTPLKTAVEKALEQTGNTGRPVEDWQIKLNDQILDTGKKIKEFNFPEGFELFLGLTAGIGGNI